MFTPSGRTLTVGPTGTYRTLRDAVAASKAGDRIDVQAGTYVDDTVTVTHDLEIVGIGGRADFTVTHAIDNGKAIIVVAAGANVNIANLGFIGARVADQNGAGIRHEGADLVVTNSLFRDNENGILTNWVAGATLTVDRSEFDHNGLGEAGRTHAIYATGIASVTVTNSYFHDTEHGHHIKSRAAVTTVIGNRLIDGDGTSSYSIDVSNGGIAMIQGNYIEQGEKGENATLVAYGAEGNAYATASLTVTGNVLVSKMQGRNSYGVYNFPSGVQGLAQNNRYANVDNSLAGSFIQSNDSRIDAPADRSAPGAGGDGTPGVDLITGGAGNDTIRGFDGADSINGGAGDDDVNGNQGNDAVRGGAGADLVRGGQGDDLVAGDDGDDSQVNGNLGSDSVYGGAGNDAVFGGQGNDLLFGDAGNDTLSGDLGSDTLTGGAGADLFVFTRTSGADQITDFSFAEGDRIQLGEGLAPGAVIATAAGTKIELGGGVSIVLAGIGAAAVLNEWLVNA